VLVKYWNEEELLPLFLKMVETLNFEAICLCDDGSTDSSPEICTKYAKGSKKKVILKTIDQKHDANFEETIAEAVKINQLLKDLHEEGYDWIFHLDIDEYVSPSLKEFFNDTLLSIPPKFGIYFPILDLYNSPFQFILFNGTTGFHHYPCHHLKVFGKDSKWRRTVKGMELDQGVTGGNQYIVTSAPYFHLKYLFKNRRYLRGKESNLYFSENPIFSQNLQISETPKKEIPIPLHTWWKKWEEPHWTW
jgi:glycosyltransferase involved in cell wall biosynthesis